MYTLEILRKELSDKGYYVIGYARPENGSPITSIVCCMDEKGYIEHQDFVLNTLIDQTTLDYLRNTPREEVEKLKKIAHIDRLKKEIAKIEKTL